MEKNFWKAPIDHKVPDFIIGGAMKSGTTTLHHILASHPDIFIPDQEIGFFDMDNYLQHPDFSFFNINDRKWSYPISNENYKNVWAWYNDLFANSGEKIIGEDSTTYLASSVVPEKILCQDKKIKMIFVLRNPVDRTYSNYLHLVSSGRAVYNFEDTLKFEPFSILGRSLYLEQLSNYYKYLPKDQIKIILFEDLTTNTSNIINEVSEYLNIDFNKFNPASFKTHSNPTLFPKFFKLYLYRNFYLRDLFHSKYINNLPGLSLKPRTAKFSERLFMKIHDKINPVAPKKAPLINESSREYLSKYFYSELRGIDELTGMSILEKWFK